MRTSQIPHRREQLGNFVLCMVFALCVFASSAVAHAEPDLAGRLEAYVVTQDDDGQEQLAAATEALPGTVIEYHVVYTNVGDEAVSRLQVQGPVPAGATYLGGTAKAPAGHELEVSIDGGNAWGVPPLYRTVNGVDGSPERQRVPAEEYDRLRWSVPGSFQPQAIVRYAYRVRIDDGR